MVLMQDTYDYKFEKTDHIFSLDKVIFEHEPVSSRVLSAGLLFFGK